MSKHMAEHIYMFCGESVNVTIKTTVDMMDTLVDWFGKDFRIVSKDEKQLTVSVRCNEKAIFYWALQYGPYVEVLAPAQLRSKLAEAISAMNDKYKV